MMLLAVLAPQPGEICGLSRTSQMKYVLTEFGSENRC
jgi:hypothetical protein